MQLPTLSSFQKNVLSMFTGTAIAQLIPMVISLFITRIYTTEEIGLWALFTSVASVCGVVATARYEMAVVLSKDDSEALHVMGVSIIVNLLYTALLLVLFLVFSGMLAGLLRSEGIKSLLWLAAFFSFGTGIYQTLSYWLIRMKRFRLSALGRVAQAVVTAVITLLLGYWKVLNNGLILASVSGLFAACIWWVVPFFKAHPDVFQRISSSELKRVARKYINFPKFNTFHAFLNSLSGNFPVMLMAAYFSSKVVAYYGFSLRIVLLPLMLISNSISQVMNQEMAEMLNKGISIEQKVHKLMNKLVLFGIPIFVILLLAAPFLFSVFFGKEWYEAGQYTRILAPWLFMVFLNSAFSFIPPMLDKQKQNLIIEIIYFGLRMIALWIGASFIGNVYWMLGLYTVVGCMMLIYCQMWIVRISKTKTV